MSRVHREFAGINLRQQGLFDYGPLQTYRQVEATRAGRFHTAFVLLDTLLSGDELPEDVLLTATEATKTPKQWIDEFIPYARAKAAEFGRLDEEDGEEEDDSLSEYQFGMDLDGPDVPVGLVWNPIPTIVYPPFLAEEAVKQMGEDGVYAAEMREAITGMRVLLDDVQVAAGGQRGCRAYCRLCRSSH